jgi:2-iminobutanoate/2-iminopropanoate deaminase
MAACVGNLLVSSAIPGADPATGELGATPDAQAEFAFANLRTVLERAGGSLDDVVRVTVHVRDLAMREAVNAAWLRAFPDAEGRPARHLQRGDLPGSHLVQLEAMAVLQSARGEGK